MKIYARLLILIVIAVSAFAAYLYFAPTKSRVRLHAATIEDVRAMARLCSVEIYEEVPVKGKVGSRHLVAREVLVGTISFDLDSLRLEESGDTVRLCLPREIVEVYESTEPGAYTVIDNWNDNFLGSSNITTAEENRMKELVRRQFVKSVYAKGYVRRARAEAVNNLRSLLSSLTGRPVIVTDPSPAGYIPK